MKEKDFDFGAIFDSMKRNDISEVIIKEGSKQYEIRRGGFKTPQTVPHVTTGAVPVVQQVSGPAATAISAEKSEKGSTDKANNYYELKSPLVGTFYASPKPDAPAFVDVGDKVTKGKVLCIVEAMKNFNEIESEVDGTIREICVKTGDLIEFGQVLFRIEQ